MKRSVINVSMTLALGLGLTVTLLWLLSGGLSAVQAQALMATSRAGETALLQNRDLSKGPEADHPPGPQAIPLAGPSYPDKSLSTTRSELDAASRERLNQALFNLPLRFVANAGQTDPAVRFTVKGAGHTLFFTQEEVVFSAVQEVEDEPVRSVVRLRFLEASPHPTVEGLSPLSGVANFFLGNDPAQWRVNVPSYGAVAYRDLYPGVDLIYHGSEGYLKSEFRLAPEADPAAIQMVYSGLESLYLGEDGALVLQTALGELIETAPLIYQKVDGVRQVIPGGYVLLPISADLTGFRNLSGPGADAYKVGFQVGAYDSTRPLVIDPALAYSTYLGGSDQDMGRGIAVDSAGNAYVTGWTSSSDFPTTTLTIQPAYGGGTVDAFVTQIISASGFYTYGYSTYLGGNGDDRSWGIAVDDGNAYVTGWTSSSNFPTTTLAIQPGYGGGTEDAFVTQIISASGAYTLGYSTYLGGDDRDKSYSIAVDSAGNAYVTGQTWSSDFPTTTNAIDPIWGVVDAFVTKIISASGFYTYGYSSYLGGNSAESGYGIAVDGDDNIYVTGETLSNNFPTHNALQTDQGGWDAFVTQIISASGVYTYGYSTYLGGTGDDYGYDIAVDGGGNAYVTGDTQSSDFPIRNAIQTGQGVPDAFVTQIISASGVYTYGYSSYLGGTLADGGYDIAVDSAGHAYVTGWTWSLDFPTRKAIQADQGSRDAFVAKIAAPADLALSKTVTPTGSVEAGQPITSTLIYTNDGQVPATGILITDVVPTSLISVTFTSSGAQITPTGSVSCTWQVEDLSPGEGGVITITGVVSGTSGLTNRATITTTPGAYFADDNPDNNESVVQSSVGYPIYLPLIMRAYP
jgi:uncharacterized repeat protein (TIGR01451 family)